MKILLRVLLLYLLLSSCKKLTEYSPDEIRPVEENLNLKNIKLISRLPVKDTFSFILMADPQRFYDELDAFVSHVNSLTGISFVLMNGDITDFGLSREYNLVAERLKKLHIPYVAAIGNHDMLANGRLVFDKMFGPENFSFTYGSNKFIVFNANSREVGYDGTLPDITWLRNESVDGRNYRNVFFMSHVPPFSIDFDKDLEMTYASMVASTPNARLSMHGHDHTFEYGIPYNDGIPYLVTGTIGERNYVLVTVKDKIFSIDEINY